LHGLPHALAAGPGAGRLRARRPPDGPAPGDPARGVRTGAGGPAGRGRAREPARRAGGASSAGRRGPAAGADVLRRGGDHHLPRRQPPDALTTGRNGGSHMATYAQELDAAFARTDPGIRVDEVRTTSDRDAFVQLPYRLYRDDPRWVPPLMMER